MATATTFVQDWIRYWGNFATGLTRSMESATRDARRRDYTPGKLLSDAVALWAEGVDAWYGMLLGARGEGPAVLLLRVSRDTEAKVGSARVTVPGDGDPERTDLVRVGGGASIPRDHIRLVVSPARDEIEVHLTDLRRINPDSGYYLGLVHVGERPLVLIHVMVTP